MSKKKEEEKEVITLNDLPFLSEKPSVDFFKCNL